MNKCPKHGGRAIRTRLLLWSSIAAATIWIVALAIDDAGTILAQEPTPTGAPDEPPHASVLSGDAELQRIRTHSGNDTAQPATSSEKATRSLGQKVVAGTLVAEEAPPGPETNVINKEGALRDIEFVRTRDGGYLIDVIQGSSIYDRIGIQPGDVVYDLDALFDLQYPQEALERFKNPEVRFVALRDGKPIRIQYRLDSLM